MRRLVLLNIVLWVMSAMAADKIKKDDVLANGNWKELYDQYSIEPSALKSLKSITGESYRIDVYFGFWCPDSVRNVPPFIKITDAVDARKIQVNYYRVDRKTSGARYYVEELKVERVPTFIFYKDGQEIGRIVENPQKSLVQDFLEIVF